MSAENFQRWMTAIGVWLAVTLISVGLFALTETVESTLFTVLFAFVTLLLVVFGAIDLSGVRADAEG